MLVHCLWFASREPGALEELRPKDGESQNPGSGQSAPLAADVHFMCNALLELWRAHGLARSRSARWLP